MDVSDELKLLDFGRESRTKSGEIEFIILYGLSANEEYLPLQASFKIIFEHFSINSLYGLPAKNVTESENKYVIDLRIENELI
jgi:hypothetical protein